MSEQNTGPELDGNKKEDWMNAKCTCDFVIFPVLWSILHAVMHTGNTTQWNPLTLQGAGLFHMAMGAIIGVAAFGRTQEKLAGANNGGAAGATPSFGAPSAPSSFGTPAVTAPVTSGFASTPAVSTPVTGGFGGTTTPAPAVSKFGKVVPQQEDPVL